MVNDYTWLAISDGGEPYWRVWAANSAKSISVDEELSLNHYISPYENPETGLDTVDIVVKVQVPGAIGVFNILMNCRNWIRIKCKH
jgi:hypothetical protein